MMERWLGTYRDSMKFERGDLREQRDVEGKKALGTDEGKVRGVTVEDMEGL